MTYKGDFENQGLPIIEAFYTHKVDGSLTSAAEFRNVAQDGPPTFAIRNVNTGVRSTAGLSVLLDTVPPDGQVTGRHKMTLDTTADPNFYLLGQNYELIIVDGAINSDGTGTWIDLRDQAVMTIPLQTRTPGIVLDRAVKVVEFAVESLGPDNSEFTVSGIGLQTDLNFYKLQNISWQTGAQNFGTGYVVHSSTDAGAGNVTLQLQRLMAKAPLEGDKGVFLPEERPDQQYWANIVPEFGPADEYTLRWYNGTKETEPDDNGDTFLTVKQVSASSPPKVDNAVMGRMEAGSNVFTYSATGAALIPQDEKADITCSAIIDGELRTYNRIYPNAVSQ